TDSGSFNTVSLAFVEGLYSAYLQDPNSVPADWRSYFAQNGGEADQVGPTFKPRSVFDPAPAKFQAPAPAAREVRPAEGAVQVNGSANALLLQDRVDALVRAYRVRGHMVAHIDPLG